MARARKTVATTKKHLTKNEIKTRSAEESRLKLDRDDLVVPRWLSENLIAHNEFVRVVEEAGKIGLLDNLDLSILAIYCKAYSSYVDCTKKIEICGYIDANKGSVSPYVNAQAKYVEQIFKCSSKLGLATTDRLKLIVPGAEEVPENKFFKYAK